MPLAVKHILFPTDFSESADFALSYAIEFAQIFQAGVTLLHVISGPIATEMSAKEIQDYLEVEKRAARPALSERLMCVLEAGLRGAVVMAEGGPSPMIVEIAQKLHVDFILMGTHGRAGLAHMIKGSVAARVTRLAPCPVLVTGIKKNRIQEDRRRMPSAVKHILVPTDFREPADYALDYAIQCAQTFQARLTILHVISPPVSIRDNLCSRYREMKKTPSGELQMRLSRVLKTGLQGNSIVVKDTPFRFIFEMAENRDIDLIIMGAYRQTGLKRSLTSSIAERVARLAPCPVLVTQIPR